MHRFTAARHRTYSRSAHTRRSRPHCTRRQRGGPSAGGTMVRSPARLASSQWQANVCSCDYAVLIGVYKRPPKGVRVRCAVFGECVCGDVNLCGQTKLNRLMLGGYARHGMGGKNGGCTQAGLWSMSWRLRPKKRQRIIASVDGKRFRFCQCARMLSTRIALRYT